MSIDSSQLSATLSALINQSLQQFDIDAKTLQQLSQQIDTLLLAGQRHRQANWAGHMTPAVNELAAEIAASISVKLSSPQSSRAFM